MCVGRGAVFQVEGRGGALREGHRVGFAGRAGGCPRGWGRDAETHLAEASSAFTASFGRGNIDVKDATNYIRCQAGRVKLPEKGSLEGWEESASERRVLQCSVKEGHRETPGRASPARFSQLPNDKINLHKRIKRNTHYDHSCSVVEETSAARA